MTNPETIRVLGWCLLHFVWQGAVLALVLSRLVVAPAQPASALRQCSMRIDRDAGGSFCHVRNFATALRNPSGRSRSADLQRPATAWRRCAERRAVP